MGSNEDKWERFGKWLQAERQKTGVTQARAAKGGEIDVIHLSRIENGRSGVKDDTLRRIVTSINKQSPDYQINIATAFAKAGFHFIDQDGMDVDDGLFSGLHKLPPSKRPLAKRQIKSIIDALLEEENPDTDYID